MPHAPDEQQTLTPPQTRLTQAWHYAWQRYYGNAPRGLMRTQRVVLPAIKQLAYKHGRRR